MNFDSGNYIGQNPFVKGDSCTACHTQTFGNSATPGYKCVNQLCGTLCYSLLCDFTFK